MAAAQDHPGGPDAPAPSRRRPARPPTSRAAAAARCRSAGPPGSAAGTGAFQAARSRVHPVAADRVGHLSGKASRFFALLIAGGIWHRHGPGLRVGRMESPDQTLPRPPSGPGATRAAGPRPGALPVRRHAAGYRRRRAGLQRPRWRMAVPRGRGRQARRQPDRRAADRARSAMPPDLWLLFAPIKKARTDFIVEKAAEMGAARILPVQTEFTNSERIRQDRLQAHAVEAAEQCGGTYRPARGRHAAAGPAAGGLAGRPAPGLLRRSHRRRPAGPPGSTMPRAGPGPSSSAPRAASPPTERARLRRCPSSPASRLGPRILRADTAAVAALTLWQARLGDWVASSGPRCGRRCGAWREAADRRGAGAGRGLCLRLDLRRAWSLFGWSCPSAGAVVTFAGIAARPLPHRAAPGPAWSRCSKARSPISARSAAAASRSGNWRGSSWIRRRGEPLWILTEPAQPPLRIPVDAAGAEHLFDVFAALPGIHTERMLAELKRRPRQRVTIWQARPGLAIAQDRRILRTACAGARIDTVARRVHPSCCPGPRCRPRHHAQPSTPQGALMSIPQSGGGPIERPEQLAEYLAAGCKPKDGLAHRDRAREVRLLQGHAPPAALRRPALDPRRAGRGCATASAGAR